MTENFTFNGYVYQQDDQLSPDESNIPVHLFPETMYDFSPIRFHTPWEAFHELEYYPSPEYPHPLMICPPPPAGSSFDDLTYARREFQSPDDSVYLSSESSPTTGALVTPNDEEIGEDDLKGHRSCRVVSRDTKKNEKGHKKTQNPRSKEKKKCYNCLSTKSPSWRRSISGPNTGCLLCNACGLYEKTSKSKRMLVSDEEGTLKVVRKRDKANYVCHRCGNKDSTRWKKNHNKIYCDKCAKAHSKN